jgi:hypothetical protein
LQWCGTNHLLLDTELIDVELKMDVWRYAWFGGQVRGAVDGRFWHILGGKLVASTLPDAAASQMLASIRRSGAQTVLGPGGEISIQMNLAGPAGDANFATNLTSELTQHLDQNKMTVRNGAPVLLTVSGAVETTKDLWELTTITGNGAIQKRNFPVKNLTINMSLTDRNGRSIWQEKRTFGPTRPTRRFNGNEDPEKTLETEMWNLGKAYVSHPNLPVRAYLIGGNVVVLPGSSTALKAD